MSAASTRCWMRTVSSIVCLAGYMRMLTPWLVERWSGRMLNIHPSLLPAYKGLDTHARVLAAGETRHGCTRASGDGRAG